MRKYIGYDKDVEFEILKENMFFFFTFFAVQGNTILAKTQNVNLQPIFFMAHFEAKPHMIPVWNLKKTLSKVKCLLGLHEVRQ